MTEQRRRLVVGVAVGLLVVLGGVSAVGDPAKDLRSKDVATRLKAVEAIRRDAPRDAEKLLLEALGDRDWEVVERASAALGQHGERGSMDPLLKLALTGPVRRIRLTAARSLLLIDADSAAKAVLKRMSGKMAEAACEALAVLAPALEDETVTEALRRGLSSKKLPVRIAAARLVGDLDGTVRRTALERILAMSETSVRAAALDAVRASARPADIRYIKPLLYDESVNDVLARRVIAAIVSIVGAAGDAIEGLLPPHDHGSLGAVGANLALGYGGMRAPGESRETNPPRGEPVDPEGTLRVGPCPPRPETRDTAGTGLDL